MMIGPEGAVALLVASALAPLADAGSADYVTGSIPAGLPSFTRPHMPGSQLLSPSAGARRCCRPGSIW
jgi:hypothetical protein